MVFHLRDILSKLLQLVLLLALTQTLLLSVVSGQEPESGKVDKETEKGAVENKAGDSKTKKGQAGGIVGGEIIAKPGTTRLEPRAAVLAPAAELPEDPYTVIVLYPCKARRPAMCLESASSGRFRRELLVSSRNWARRI